MSKTHKKLNEKEEAIAMRIAELIATFPTPLIRLSLTIEDAYVVIAHISLALQHRENNGVSATIARDVAIGMMNEIDRYCPELAFLILTTTLEPERLQNGRG